MIGRILLFTGLVCLPLGAWCEEPATQPAAPAEKNESAEAKDSPKEAPKGATNEEAKTEEPASLYDVPKTTDVDVLAAHLKKLLDFQAQTPVENLEHRRKSPDAIFLTADRIVSFAKDRQSASYRLAYPHVALRQLRGIYLKSLAEKQQFLNEVQTYVAAGEIGDAEAILMLRTAMALEDDDGENGLAIEAYQKFAAVMKESTNERAQELAARLDGNIRRLKLPGQEMAIVGMTYEGEKFDLTSLQGKVVLVDFWATWCGPCRAEIPNMKALYKKYHERGLEIVGISTDDDRGALDEFLKEEQLPWIILHEEEGKSEAAVHYGISALPTMILIGRDAKVLSIHARGPALAEKLAELFPEEGAKDSQ